MLSATASERIGHQIEPYSVKMVCIGYMYKDFMEMSSAGAAAKVDVAGYGQTCNPLSPLPHRANTTPLRTGAKVQRVSLELHVDISVGLELYPVLQPWLLEALPFQSRRTSGDRHPAREQREQFARTQRIYKSYTHSAWRTAQSLIRLLPLSLARAVIEVVCSPVICEELLPSGW